MTTNWNILVEDALGEATGAGLRGDHPVGAVLTHGGSVVTGANSIATSENLLLHAETDVLLRAISEGVSTVGSRLYSTVEPCPMCLGAIIVAGVSELAFGATLIDIFGEDGAALRYGNYTAASLLATLGQGVGSLVVFPRIGRQESIDAWLQGGGSNLA